MKKRIINFDNILSPYTTIYFNVIKLLTNRQEVIRLSLLNMLKYWLGVNMKKLLVIIPAFNEENNIVNTIKSIKRIESDYCLIDYIVVNDCSVDNTLEVIIKNEFNYISLPLNLGIGGAVQTGYKYAFDNGYDYAVQFDGDGQHDATYIEALITELEKGVDLVIGSRFINDVSEFKSTKIRRIGISILSFLIKIFTGKKITDPTSGFRACNKKIIELFSDNYPIDYPEPDSIVYVLKKGYSVFEIPVKMKERVNGLSSINAFKSVYYMIKVSLAIMITALSTKGEKNEN